VLLNNVWLYVHDIIMLCFSSSVLPVFLDYSLTCIANRYVLTNNSKFTEIPSYSILVLKDQYNLCISDVRTEYLPLKLPINNNEDDVVEMYKEYFKRKPQVKHAVIGKNISEIFRPYIWNT
jgi:hypothetical protein